ncbi:MAG: ABC transporter ATP-binding protein [Tepidiformaceae bacterium]
MSVTFRARRRLGPFEYDAAFEAGDEIVVLFGHSGAGKSVTLQLVAGLMRPDEGAIAIDGRAVFDSETGVNLPAQERGVGYVVQDLALFPHLTVAENVAFGMDRRLNRSERESRVRELLARLDLSGFERRKPRTLSGGQQQRVALARALARDCRVLLLDEPFSALDDTLRATLRRELLRLHTEFGLTVLFVTHDLREAHLLADKLAVFDEGRLLQFGPRNEVFRRPASRRVAELTGVTNLWRGRVVASEGANVRVLVDGLVLAAISPAADAPKPGSDVELVVRAERVNIRRDYFDQIPGRNVVQAAIVEEYAYGASHSLRFQPNGAGPVIEVEIAARPYEVLGIATRKSFTLELMPEDIHIVVPGT